MFKLLFLYSVILGFVNPCIKITLSHELKKKKNLQASVTLHGQWPRNDVNKPLVRVIFQISMQLCHSIHVLWGMARVPWHCWWLMSYAIAMVLQRDQGKTQLSTGVTIKGRMYWHFSTVLISGGWKSCMPKEFFQVSNFTGVILSCKLWTDPVPCLSPLDFMNYCHLCAKRREMTVTLRLIAPGIVFNITEILSYGLLSSNSTHVSLFLTV